MFLMSQIMIYLALALLVGGLIGYAFRACLVDTAVDDVRNDLKLAEDRHQEMLAQQQSEQVVPILKPVPPEPLPPVAAGLTPFPVAPPIVANDILGPKTQSLSDLSTHDLEATLLQAAPGTSPRMRFTADDLTAITGLTPKMDAFLAKMGITRLADIASLTPSELYWLVENLPDDGASVYRDHWVAQATRLLADS